jgi:Uma2 family endonuclease
MRPPKTPSGSLIPPSSGTQDQLRAQIAEILDDQLAGSRFAISCWAGISAPEDAGSIFIPDIVVSRLPPGDACPVTDPLVILEVLPPDIATWPRSIKLPAYCGLPSIQEVLLIDSSVRFVEMYRRGDDGKLLYELMRFPGDCLALPRIGLELCLDAIYGGLDIAPAPGTEIAC